MTLSSTKLWDLLSLHHTVRSRRGCTASVENRRKNRILSRVTRWLDKVSSRSIVQCPCRAPPPVRASSAPSAAYSLDGSREATRLRGVASRWTSRFGSARRRPDGSREAV
eukprot:4309966-Pyramimonas_sp.AAC.2